MSRAILIFAKSPVPGRVKTRLAAEVGAEEAARIYRVLTATVCAQLPEDAGRLVFHDPPEERLAVKEWMGPLVGKDAVFLPQASGDLGARLEAACDAAFALGHGPVVLVGTDCVELTPEMFQEAFARLERCDCVIVPVEDGGYCLLGLNAPCGPLFRDIEWSSSRTLEGTLQRAAEVGLAVQVMATLHDVDSVRDWERARRFLGGEADA